MNILTSLFLSTVLATSSLALASDVTPGSDVAVSVMLIDGDYVTFEGVAHAKTGGDARFAYDVPKPETRIQVTPAIRGDDVIDLDITVRQAAPQNVVLDKHLTVQPGQKAFVSFGDDLRYTLQVSADRDLYFDN